jgi:ech hydrogenase subunit D
MREEITPVRPAELIGEVAKLKIEGYRFVTLSCTEIDASRIDVLYHFDKDLGLKHLRLTALKTEPLPSISPVYFAALLIENEIQDLFGLKFQGLVVDYQGMLYLEEEALKTPFCKFSIQTAEKAAALPVAPSEPAETPAAPSPEVSPAAALPGEPAQGETNS